MTTLRQFANKMRKLDKELPQQLNSIVMRAAARILEDLVTVTPIDTGRAISNWQVSYNTPVGTTISAHVPGSRGYTLVDNSRITYELGLMVIDNKLPGESLVISNALDYITDLNNGSSRQAPANFVERAVIIGNDIIQKGTLNVN
jgi:hypothetical protein